MNQVQPIEGITPAMLWDFVLVLLGLCAVIVTVYKVVEIIRKEHERKEEKARRNGKDFTDEIAEKVLAKLEPRFKEIDEKLDRDKKRLEVHESYINQINTALSSIREGMEVSCNALAEVLDHELHNGNGSEMEKASAELRKYTTGLIKKV